VFIFMIIITSSCARVNYLYRKVSRTPFLPGYHHSIGKNTVLGVLVIVSAEDPLGVAEDSM